MQAADATDLAPVDAYDPARRRHATRNANSPVMIVVAVAALIGILAYAWFLLNPSNRGDVIPWVIVIVCETVLVFHALMAM